jgi:16S rRNA (guanine1207-N2)-methyltransferase
MTHYFTDNADLPSDRKEIRWTFHGHEFIFLTDTGVFSRDRVDYGTGVLLETALSERFTGRLLDLGCGYGVVGIVLKTFYPDTEIEACDINSRSVELAGLNSNINHASVHTVVSDRFEKITGTFSAILANPPIRAGKETVYGMFQESYDHLEAGGVFLAVVRRQQGAESALRKITGIFGNAEAVQKDKGYWVIRAVKGKIDELTGLC